MSERKFEGVWIPAKLWLDRSLTITEKVMFIEIKSLESDDRGCYAGNARFAEFFDLSISRVSEVISSLAKKGLIEITQIREGKRVVERQIRIVKSAGRHPFGKGDEPPSGKASNPFGKGGEPPSGKAKERSTSMNNTDEGNHSLAPQGADIEVKVERKQGVPFRSADLFAQAWDAYPKRSGNNRNLAAAAWDKRVKDGADPKEMLAGAVRYAAFCVATDKTGTEYVKQVQTFFGKAEHWLESWDAPRRAGARATSSHTGLHDLNLPDGITHGGL